MGILKLPDWRVGTLKVPDWRMARDSGRDQWACALAPRQAPEIMGILHQDPELEVLG